MESYEKTKANSREDIFCFSSKFCKSLRKSYPLTVSCLWGPGLLLRTFITSKTKIQFPLRPECILSKFQRGINFECLKQYSLLYSWNFPVICTANFNFTYTCGSPCLLSPTLVSTKKFKIVLPLREKLRIKRFVN